MKFDIECGTKFIHFFGDNGRYEIIPISDFHRISITNVNPDVYTIELIGHFTYTFDASKAEVEHLIREVTSGDGDNYCLLDRFLSTAQDDGEGTPPAPYRNSVLRELGDLNNKLALWAHNTGIALENLGKTLERGSQHKSHGDSPSLPPALNK